MGAKKSLGGTRSQLTYLSHSGLGLFEQSNTTKEVQLEAHWMVFLLLITASADSSKYTSQPNFFTFI